MSNPKAYYNQTEYENARPSSASRSDLLHKPDDASSDMPPPPYSPPASSSTPGRIPSDDPHRYGSVSPPRGVPDAENSQKYLPMHLVQPSPPPSQQPPTPSSRSAPNPHIPIHWSNDDDMQQQRRRRDPGCCKNWCKYICLAFLIWIVLLKYGTWFRPSTDAPGHHSPSDHVQCNSLDTAVVWDELPGTIDVEKNVWVALEGHVTGGQVRVHRQTEGGPGKIKSTVRVAPSSLAQRMDYTLRQGEATQLTLNMPNQPLRKGECVEVDMDIYLPKDASELRVALSQLSVEISDDLDDVTVLDIKTYNAPIHWATGSTWKGKTLRMETHNAEIVARGHLKSDDTMSITTVNGDIMLGDVSAKHRIDLSSSNGRLVTQSVETDGTLQWVTSNAAIELDRIKADQIILKSSNGAIRADGLVGRVISISTSNARVDCVIHGDKESTVNAKTSNAPVSVRMTTEFKGTFSVGTSSYSSATLHDAKRGVIQYTTRKDYLKRGQRLQGNGDVTVETSNAEATLTFDA